MQGQVQDQYGMEGMEEYANDPKRATRAAGVSIFQLVFKHSSTSNSKVFFHIYSYHFSV
jgi:hypothetical protein